MKKYRLLKDTVEVKAGAIFVYKERIEKDMGDHKRFIPAGYYLEDFIFNGQISAPYYERDVIENIPEWFEEVVEKDFELTERQMQIQELLHNNVIDNFEVNKEKGSIKIKQAYLNHFAKNIESLFNQDHLKGRVVDSSFHVKTEDGFDCTDGDKIYGIAIQASGIDQWREQKLPFKTPISESRKWFKHKERATEYLIRNKRIFSIEDILRSKHFLADEYAKEGQSFTEKEVHFINNLLDTLYREAKERI